MRIVTLIMASLTLLVSISATADVDIQPDEYVVFYHHDVLGSPVTATNELGQAIWHERTESYGKSEGRFSNNGNAFGDNALPAANSRQGYTGHTLDNSAGLTYMKARYYDHNIGRFLSNDPVGFTAENPMMFNRYAYANNNPYAYVDPDGKYASDMFSEQDVNTYMSTPLDIAIETGVVGGDAVAVDRLTYGVGKDHWTNGEGVDILVTEALSVSPTGPRYNCIDGSSDTCQTTVVSNPRDYSGSGQVTIRNPAGITTIDPEPYEFELKEESSLWNITRNIGASMGEDNHGIGDSFDVHYFSPAILWHGYKNPRGGLR